MIWNDARIAEWAASGGITPFVPQCVRVNDSGEKVISYGLQSFGYDIRLARQYSCTAGTRYTASARRSIKLCTMDE